MSTTTANLATTTIVEGFPNDDGTFQEIPVTLTVNVTETWKTGTHLWGSGTVVEVSTDNETTRTRWMGTKKSLYLGNA